MKMKILIIALWCFLILLKLKFPPLLVMFTLFIVPSIFYIIFRDKANTFRVALLSCTVIPHVPLQTTLIFLFLPLILNDEWLRKVAKWKLIVFTGIDGSGKTTHSIETVRYLRTKGIDCAVYHWFRQLLVSSASIAYAKILGKPIIRHRYTRGKNVYTDAFRKRIRTSMAMFRPLLQLIDNWIFIGTMLLINMIKGRWVICDRYFYDYYIRFKVLGYPVPKILEWVVYEFTPNPHLLIVFDVNPVISYKRRRGEHPLWYYVYARKEYLRIAKNKKGVVINTEKPFKEVQNEVNKTILRVLSVK